MKIISVVKKASQYTLSLLRYRSYAIALFMLTSMINLYGGNGWHECKTDIADGTACHYIADQSNCTSPSNVKCVADCLSIQTGTCKSDSDGTNDNYAPFVDSCFRTDQKGSSNKYCEVNPTS